MPKLKALVLIHTTSNDDANANSTARFSLEINRPGPDVTIGVPDNPNQRQKGQLDIYNINVSDRNIDSDDAGFSVVMSIKSDDGWLPKSIFLFGQTEDAELIVLGNHPYWYDWFDTGVNPVQGSKPSHAISGGGELP